MITKEIKYGGTLQQGDFIGVGSNYGMLFGWYVGCIKVHTIQFISPATVLQEFIAYKNKQFTFEHISKDQVKDLNHNRIIKIHNPDDIFDLDDRERYRLAKKVLQDLDFFK